MTLILVIDDEISIVEMLSALLEEEGLQVMTAYNGQEGLERLANAQPAVVVSDVMMPVLDGWELCRRMQADPRYRSIPVVLMSAVRTESGWVSLRGPGQEAVRARGDAPDYHPPPHPQRLILTRTPH